MPPAMQAKLLRRAAGAASCERVGGERPIAVDVRVIVATHRDLESLGRARACSARTCTTASTSFPIALPPLRERPDDVPLLAQHFAAPSPTRTGGSRAAFAPDGRRASSEVPVARQRPRAAERRRARAAAHR